MTTGLNVVNIDIDKINILWLCKYLLKVSKHSKKVETARMRLYDFPIRILCVISYIAAEKIQNAFGYPYTHISS